MTNCTWTLAAVASSNSHKQKTDRRWLATTPQWPIMHAVTYGISRDQMMARHKANHIQVALCRICTGRRQRAGRKNCHDASIGRQRSSVWHK